jgi:hypothetical protein
VTHEVLAPCSVLNKVTLRKNEACRCINMRYSPQPTCTTHMRKFHFAGLQDINPTQISPFKLHDQKGDTGPAARKNWYSVRRSLDLSSPKYGANKFVLIRSAIRYGDESPIVNP